MSRENAARMLREIRIFLASPGDVAKERDIVENVIKELNITIASPKDAVIRLLRWETDVYPHFHNEKAQLVIDEQVDIENSDIFLCILWQRMSTRMADSGTEHEFSKAYNAWKKTGKPKIMLYRSLALPPSLKDVNPAQLLELSNFLNNPKVKPQWVTEYKDADSFSDVIRPHLSLAIQNILEGKTDTANSEVADDVEMLKKLSFSKEDWKPVTHNTLKKYNVELPKNEAILFFDGLEPSWKQSISSSIARREVVDDLVKEMTREDAVSPHIVVLHGLGGEGKSTALQQALYEIVSKRPDTYILWHQQTNTPLSPDIINELSKTGYLWIIASDDAHIIEKDLEKIARYIRQNDIENISFLLATRDVDWKSVGGDKYGWGMSGDFKKFPIRLTDKDALLIVEKWRNYGEQGLGRLKEKDTETAVHELLERARTETGSSIDKTLLGAMLQVRTGKTMQEHLKVGLERLDSIQTPVGISLKKAMAYIAALHSYNIKILTPEILANALKCPEENLQEWVIKPLGAEIRVGKYILVRHVSIAEATKDVLEEEYDFTEIMRNLLHSSHNLFKQSKIRNKEDINDWHRLPKTMYFDKSNKQLGIALAEESMEAQRLEDSKYDSVTVTDLAYLYEQSRRSEMAVRVFRENYAYTKVDRAYYYKWSVAEGKAGHHFINVWLCAVSLADGIFEQRRDKARIYISLSGLSTAFRLLFEQVKKYHILEACYTCAKYGLQNGPDDRAMENLLNNLKFSKEAEATFKEGNALNVIKNGVEFAWSQWQQDLKEEATFGVFPKNVPEPKSLKFIWLAGKLNP